MGNKAWGDFGMQAAQGALGAGMGLILGGINDRRQLKQQEKLQNLEISGQKQMTDYNMQKQLQMWKDTSYGAQVEQMQKAGINPALMYGMGGGGGQSMGQANGNVTGAHAPVGGGEGMAMMQTAAQMGLLRAQKELTEAQRDKTLAEVPKIGAEVPNIQADTTLKGLQGELLKGEKQLQDIAINTAADTYDAVVGQVYATLRETEAKADLIKTEGEVASATKQDAIKQIRAEAIGAVLMNAKLRAEKTNIEQNTAESKEKVTLMRQQFKEIGHRIMTMWEGVADEARRTRVLQDSQLWKELQLPEAISGAAAGAAAGIMTRGMGAGKANQVGFKIK